MSAALVLLILIFCFAAAAASGTNVASAAIDFAPDLSGDDVVAAAIVFDLAAAAVLVVDITTAALVDFMVATALVVVAATLAHDSHYASFTIQVMKHR